MEAYEVVWMAMDGYGGEWRLMEYTVHHYRLAWTAMEAYGKVWMAVDGYEGIWRFMEYCTSL